MAHMQNRHQLEQGMCANRRCCPATDMRSKLHSLRDVFWQIRDTQSLGSHETSAIEGSLYVLPVALETYKTSSAYQVTRIASVSSPLVSHF